MTSRSNVILVTGGSSGLGKSMCVRLSGAGHRVYGTSRKAPDPSASETFEMIVMDVTDTRSVEQAVASVMEREGRIDVVVNNAGVGIQGPAEDITPELAMRALDTNLIGTHRVCRAVLPHMRKQGKGMIINISSVTANFGLPYRSMYSASKAGVERYTEALSIEMRRFGIDVVSVQPGEFNTNTGNVRLKPEKISPAHRTGYEKAMAILSNSLHYSRDPDELAKVVERIIKTRRPKTRYIVAKGMQRLSVEINKFLPGRMFQRLLGKHYE